MLFKEQLAAGGPITVTSPNTDEIVGRIAANDIKGLLEIGRAAVPDNMLEKGA